MSKKDMSWQSTTSGSEVRHLLARDSTQQLPAGARSRPAPGSAPPPAPARAALCSAAQRRLDRQAVGHHLGRLVARGTEPGGERVRRPEAALHQRGELLGVRALAEARACAVVRLQEARVVGVHHQHAHQSRRSSIARERGDTPGIAVLRERASLSCRRDRAPLFIPLEVVTDLVDQVVRALVREHLAARLEQLREVVRLLRGEQRPGSRGLEETHVVGVSLRDVPMPVHGHSGAGEHPVHLEAPGLTMVALQERRARREPVVHVAPDLHVELAREALQQRGSALVHGWPVNAAHEHHGVRPLRIRSRIHPLGAQAIQHAGVEGERKVLGVHPGGAQAGHEVRE